MRWTREHSLAHKAQLKSKVGFTTQNGAVTSKLTAGNELYPTVTFKPCSGLWTELVFQMIQATSVLEM